MGKDTNFEAAASLIRRQEELLQFDSFTNADAWELGRLMVEEIKARGIELAVCIRKVNGNIVFQYATDGTNLNNQRWMMRKYHTVAYMETSSLLATVMSHITEEKIATHGLSDTEYVLCGGGFPIKIKGSGMTMVVTVSNLPHEKDHGFIVDCLAKYLNVEATALTEEIPIP